MSIWTGNVTGIGNLRVWQSQI